MALKEMLNEDLYGGLGRRPLLKAVKLFASSEKCTAAVIYYLFLFLTMRESSDAGLRTL